MTETRDGMFIASQELDCERIPEWLGRNPGWHRWRDLMREFVGYQPPHSRAIRERLASEGRIIVSNNSRGGKPILVAHPTETSEPAARQRPRKATAQAAALVALAEAFRRMEENTCLSRKALERIAELMEHLVHGPSREEPPK